MIVTMLAQTAWDGPTIFSAVVGTVALLLALLSFGWQILRWRRSRLTIMRVSMIRVPTLGTPGGKPNAEALVISALNLSDFKVRVESVGLDFSHDQHFPKAGTFGWPVPVGATLPGVVEPMDAGYTARAHRDGYNDERGHFPEGTRLRAFVTTADGKRFETECVEDSEIPMTFGIGRSIPLPPSLRDESQDE